MEPARNFPGNMPLSMRPACAQSAVPWPELKRHVLPDARVWTLIYRTPLGYLLRFPSLADFTISQDGCHAECSPALQVDAATIEHLYLNQVYPLMRVQQGLPAFHASVVTVGSGAVAFLGSSGMGKSTLATWFCRNGSQFLTDDGMLVDEQESGWLVQPNHPSIRLWEDSIDALLDSTYVPTAAVSFTSKERLLAANNNLSWCNEPKPLLAAFLLQNDDVDSIKLTPGAGISGMMAWVNNAFVLDSEDPAQLSRHFNWVQRINARVPLWHLDYPRNYAQLPAVAAAVRNLVSAGG